MHNNGVCCYLSFQKLFIKKDLDFEIIKEIIEIYGGTIEKTNLTEDKAKKSSW